MSHPTWCTGGEHGGGHYGDVGTVQMAKDVQCEVEVFHHEGNDRPVVSLVMTIGDEEYIFDLTSGMARGVAYHLIEAANLIEGTGHDWFAPQG